MKHFCGYIITLTLSLITLSCTNNKRINDLQKTELNGSVKQCTYHFYSMEFKLGGITKSDYWSASRYEYNNNGMLEKSGSFDSYDKDYIPSQQYIYDSIGRLTKVLNYYSDKEIRSIELYEYDDRGVPVRTTEKTQSRGESSIDRVTATSAFDENGNQIEWTLFSYDGEIRDRYNYKYDSKGNIIEIVKFDKNNIIESKITRSYNPKNEEISRKEYDSFGRLVHDYKYIHVYDSKNNWIKRLEIEADSESPNSVIERTIEYYDESAS